MGKRRKNKNKNKNKAGVTMLGNIKKAIGFGAASTTLPSSNQKEFSTLSVPLFMQKTLNEIRDIGMPVAGGAEYQVHYRGLQIVIENADPESDARRIVFTIPTVFFNFPQTVTSVSVDFSLDEVAAISEQVIPISDALTQKFYDAFPTDYFIEQGWTVEARELEMGSIHRHPGNFGFSGTDLDNKADNPGVIFRNLECEDKVQVDSVMYMPSKTADVTLVTTETRIVDVAPVDDGIDGSYAQASTLAYIAQNAVDVYGFEDFFGDTSAADIITSMEFKKKKDELDSTDNYPKIDEILEKFIADVAYDPQVLVSPDYIKTRTYQYARPTYGKPGAGRVWRNGKWDDDAADRGYDAYDEYGVYESAYPAKTESKAATFRPSWRKNQTLSALRLKDIPIDNIPEIDGSGDDSDAIAIITAMKEASFTDIQIRGLLSQMEYPVSSMSLYYTNLAELTAVAKDNEKAAEDPETIVAEVEMSSADVSGLQDEKIISMVNEMKAAGMSDTKMIQAFNKNLLNGKQIVDHYNEELTKVDITDIDPQRVLDMIDAGK